MSVRTPLWRRIKAKALAGSARALARLGDGMLRVQSPEGAMPPITTFLSHAMEKL